MLQPLQLQQVSSHYPQAIAELQDFLAKTGLRLDAPETLGDMAARLQSDRAFRRDLISHVWVVLHLSGRQMTYSDLLGVLALAAAGPQLAAAADQAEAHELLRFLMEARGSFEATPASMAVVAPGTVVESRMEPPARPPLRPVAFPATAFARTRWHLQKRDSEPEPTGQRRLVWVAAACLLLAGCLGLWWHHRPAADRSAAPALPAHAAPVTAAENPPTEVADLHATSHGSEAAAGGAPSARKNSPNRPAKPSPLVLRTAPPAAAAVRPITPVHLGTSVAPPSAATDWAAATPSSQPNPLPRRRVATPAQPKPAPNPLADSAPAEATAANGGNGTANAPTEATCAQPRWAPWRPT